MGFLTRHRVSRIWLNFLTTIFIVIADIHRGLYGPAHNPKIMYLPRLTFRHWSGVTPYTSSFEFAGSCVFGKQLVGNLSLRPRDFHEAGLIANLRPLFCRVP